MKTYLEPSELQKMEDAADNARDEMMVRLLTRLGCRITELLGIAVEDIDLQRHIIRIQHLKTKVKLECPDCKTAISKKYKVCPQCGTKITKAVLIPSEKKKLRNLPIDHDTVEMLADYIKRDIPKAVVDDKGKSRLMLFPISRYQAYLIIRKLSVKAGLPCLVNIDSGITHFVSPHQLRSALAVKALKKDGSSTGLKRTQAHLGHANITTTMRYFKIAGDEEQAEWFNDLWQD